MDINGAQGILGGDAIVREKLSEVSKTDELVAKVKNVCFTSCF